jgi:putative NADH-flavin reductase
VNLAIVAATGGIGRHLLEQAIDAGSCVRVIVRNPNGLSRDVRAFTTDLSNPDPATLRSAIDGADAVLSGLGARLKADRGVAARGTRAIIQAMCAVGVRRIIVVSAAPIGTFPSSGRPNPPQYDPGDGFIMRHVLAPVIKAALHEHYTDLARMEDAIRESGTAWTIVRPPRLTNGPMTGHYRTAYGQNVRRGLSISRANVAHLMLRLVQTVEATRQAIGIAD